jgi:hypothetical protein
MIRRETKLDQNEVARYMSDTAILVSSMRMSLLEIAGQAEALGMGLQNAAPDKAGIPNNSVSYLLGISSSLKNIAEECEKLQILSRSPQSPSAS